MKTQAAIDRFERDRGQDFDPKIGPVDIAVLLLTENDQEIELPLILLPEFSSEGDILLIEIKKDEKATAKLKRETKKVQDELSKRDHGGDIRL